MTVKKRQLLKTLVRVLTLRASREELLELDFRHLALGLACALLAGIARTWDNPNVGVLQHMGLGSVAYVFLFSLFLFLIIAPLGPKNWSYKNILIYVGLTAPLGLVYGIPVEMFTEMGTAQAINLSFLAVVATWRVALLVLYLYRVAELSVPRLIVGTVFPIVLLLIALQILNVEKVVFDAMSGIHGSMETADDLRRNTLAIVALLSSTLIMPFGLGYLAIVAKRLIGARRQTA